MMDRTIWRNVPFFKESPVDAGNFFDLNGPSITSISSGVGGFFFFGRTDGVLITSTQEFSICREFSAYDDLLGISFLHYIPNTPFLFTLSDHRESGAILKLWSLDSQTFIPQTGDEPVDTTPFACLTTFQAFIGTKPFPVSAFDVFHDACQVAIGFANGTVLLIRGDLPRDRGAKQRIVFEAPEPVTGVCFSASSESLYVATTTQIVLFDMFSSQIAPRHIVDSVGVDLNSMVFLNNTDRLLAAHSEYLQVYEDACPGLKFRLSGTIESIKSVFKFLAVVRSPFEPNENGTALSHSNTLTPITKVTENIQYLSVVDIDNELLLANIEVKGVIKHVFSGCSQIFVVSDVGQVFGLEEIPASKKVELLEQQELFELALELAEVENVVQEKIKSISWKYGDYLFAQKEYAAATQQYCSAASIVNSTEVMRKLLSIGEINLLRIFLEALQASGKSTIHHATVLISSYVKLRMRDNLNAFIRNEENQFEVDEAVRVCRQACYYEEAATIAQLHGDIDSFLSTTIYDLKDYDRALTFLESLRPSELEGRLLEYGSQMMNARPEKFLKLMISYFTGQHAPDSVRNDDKHIKIQQSVGESSSQAHSDERFQSQKDRATLSDGKKLKESPQLFNKPNPNFSERLNPQIFFRKPFASASYEEEYKSNTDLDEPSFKIKNKYSVPDPQKAAPLFIRRNREYIQFLSALREHYMDSEGIIGVSKEMLESVHTFLDTSLYDAYLREMSLVSDPKEKDHWKQQAMRFLQSKEVAIDPVIAEIVTQHSSLTEGLLVIKKRRGLGMDMFYDLLESKNWQQVQQFLDKSGKDRPECYALALSHICKDEGSLSEGRKYLKQILDSILARKILSIVQVTEILGNSPYVKVEYVKPFLERAIARENKEVEKLETTIQNCREENATLQESVNENMKDSRIVQLTRCAACMTPLDYPVVHFFCRHTYHEQCLVGNADAESDLATINIEQLDDVECPRCKESFQKILKLHEVKKDIRGRQAFFKKGLSQAEDKTAFVLSMLGNVWL